MAIATNDVTSRLKKLLQTSYPEHIADVTATHIIWKDKHSTMMPLDMPQEDVKKGEEEANIIQAKLDNPTLRDQTSVGYQPGCSMYTVNYGAEPGRMRYLPFFQKMYGQTEAEVASNLVEIPWLPKTFGPNSKIKVTKVNGVAEKLTTISKELDELSPELKDFLKNPGGTFCWRLIAGTNRLSAHSFGMTIDINVARSHYWQWDYNKQPGIKGVKEIRKEKDTDYTKFPRYQNEIPTQIIDIFEKYHFIWGGKWFHYDTMHFEYRPELFHHENDLRLTAKK